jgi:hypothetical protein
MLCSISVLIYSISAQFSMLRGCPDHVRSTYGCTVADLPDIVPVWLPCGDVIWRLTVVNHRKHQLRI